MAKKSKSDSNEKVFDWIANREKGLIRQRENLKSTVCVVISNDPKRVLELKEYAVLKGITGDGDNKNVYEFEDWIGLQRLYADRKPVKVTASGGDMMGMGSDEMPIPVMLRTIEVDLKDDKKPTIAIIHGIIHPIPDLHRALNSWAFDSKMFEANSTVIVCIPSRTVKIGGQVAELIPSEVLGKCCVLEIDPSTPVERSEAIKEIAEQTGVQLDSSDIDRLVDITAGLELNQLESTLVESVALYGGLNQAHISKAKGKIISENSPIKVKMNGKFGFERVGGYTAHKRFITRRVINVLKNSEYAKECGVSLPKGVLVFGMAGTGKTILAEALATELAIPFVQITPKDIASKWYGESEEKMSNIIKAIESLSPCLVYIDEIDAIARERGEGTDHEASRKVMSELMQWMASNHNCLIWATTNRVEQIDEAILRVGRFDFKIPQLLPDVEARTEILKVHLNVVRQVPHAITDEELREVAEACDLWQGAELENLIKVSSNNVFADAVDKAVTKGEKPTITPLKKDDLLATMDSIRVNTGDRKKQQEEYLKLAEKYVNDASFLTELNESYEKPLSRAEMIMKRRKADAEE